MNFLDSFHIHKLRVKLVAVAFFSLQKCKRKKFMMQTSIIFQLYRLSSFVYVCVHHTVMHGQLWHVHGTDQSWQFSIFSLFFSFFWCIVVLMHSRFSMESKFSALHWEKNQRSGRKRTNNTNEYRSFLGKHGEWVYELEGE